MKSVLAWLLLIAPVWAGDADVIKVEVRAAGSATFNFDVTIRSADTGWARYADRIEVLAQDGAVLGIRVLDHPHEDEQPFTRDVYGVRVPVGVDRVVVRARFKPPGADGESVTIGLPGR